MNLLTTLLLSGLFLGTVPTLTVKSDEVKIAFLADMESTEGTIGGFVATIQFDKDDLANSTISGSVDTKTLETGIAKRDAHLQSADYFDAANYPKMTFKSTQFGMDGDKFVMTGDMKIKDVQREETIKFFFKDNVFEAKCVILASDYNFGYKGQDPKKTKIAISWHVPVTAPPTKRK